MTTRDPWLVRLSRRLRIRHKLAALLVVASLLPVVGASVVAFRLVAAGLRGGTRVQTERSARFGLNLMLTHLKDTLEETVRFSGDPELVASLRGHPSSITGMLRHRSALPAGLIEVANAEGKIVARDSTLAEAVITPLKDGDAPIMSALAYERRIALVRGPHSLLARTLAPVIDSDDHLVGGIVVTEPLDSDFARSLRDQLGADVVVYVDDLPVASSFRAPGGQPLLGFSGPRDPSRTILDGTENAEEVEAFGRLFSVGYVPLVDLDHRRVGMLATALDESAILRSRTNAWRSLVVGGFAAVSLVLALGLLLARRLTRPLGRLHAGALAVAKGDFRQEFTSETGDEIGELTTAFGSMTSAVRKHEERQAAHLRDLELQKHQIESLNVELQRQVAERSRELREALARLHRGRTDGLEIGKIIEDRYRVLRRIGSGGMGTVYEVERLADGKRFALKTLSRGGTSASLARFAREAEMTARLEHPNVIGMIDVGIDRDGMMFLVMELATGVPLSAQRNRFGDTSWALYILKQLVEGLAAVHAKGIVHRDLKPSNILLAGPPLTVKIVDFGLAALGSNGIVDELADTADGAPDLTQTGALMGTPAYMAPELTHGVKDAPPAADIFSLGVLAYEMLTASSPFVNPPIFDRLLGKDPPTPNALGSCCPKLNPVIALAFDRCLSSQPEQRPTADELNLLFAQEIVEEPPIILNDATKTMTLKS